MFRGTAQELAVACSCCPLLRTPIPKRVTFFPIPKEELAWLTLELRMRQTTVCAPSTLITPDGTPEWQSWRAVAGG